MRRYNLHKVSTLALVTALFFMFVVSVGTVYFPSDSTVCINIGRWHTCFGGDPKPTPKPAPCPPPPNAPKPKATPRPQLPFQGGLV